jgi:hypothetical protein
MTSAASGKRRRRRRRDDAAATVIVERRRNKTAAAKAIASASDLGTAAVEAHAEIAGLVRQALDGIVKIDHRVTRVETQNEHIIAEQEKRQPRPRRASRKA